MIIGIINSKGGVGKTTSAIYLASAFSEMGRNVVVIDMDHQGSASDWADRAEDAGTPLPFSVDLSNAKRLPRLLRALEPGTVVILDTPPGSPDVIDAAISAADFIVVPTRSYGLDVSRVWETLPSIEHLPYRVLLTQARLGTNSLGGVLASLEAEGVPTFQTVIPLRESIADCLGEVPTKHEGYDLVAEKIVEDLA